MSVAGLDSEDEYSGKPSQINYHLAFVIPPVYKVYRGYIVFVF